MINATEADIGRRVVYDARPHIKKLEHGQLVGLYDHGVIVLYDGWEGPIKVFSNLKWAEDVKGGAK